MTNRKLKILSIIKKILEWGLILTIFFIIKDYQKITDDYSKLKLNYDTLKELHTETVKSYNIQFDNNATLKELEITVFYNEHMLNASESNIKFAKYYWWILIIAPWISIYLISFLEKKEMKIIETEKS